MSKWREVVAELESDPATYAALSDADAAAAILAKTEDVPSGEIDPYLIDRVVPPLERAALKAEHPAIYDKWQAILASNRQVDPAGAEMQGMLTMVGPVPGGTGTFSDTTVAAITALGTVTRPISQGWRVPVNVRAIQKARREVV